MASDFREIEEYVPTLWHNYNPPSIDQINLKHIEDNIKINRDMINEIIKRLGEIPESPSAADQHLYDTSIYDTLKSLRDSITGLGDSKLDKSIYNAQIGDITQLQDSASPKTIVHAINNRLRKDQDDTTSYRLTIGTGTITGALTVGGNTSIAGNLSTTGTGTFTGKINANGSIGTTTLTTSGKATLNSLEVSGDSALKGKLNVTGASTLTGAVSAGGTLSTGGKATLNSLEVTGATALKNTLTVSGNTTVEEFRTNRCYIKFYEAADSATRTLFVDKNVHSLGNPDVQLVTKA